MLTLAHVRRLQGGRATRSRAHVADTPGPDGSTPLIVACKRGIIADVKLWLDYGANPALEGKQFAKPYAEDDYQVLPLTEAAKYGHGEVVALLLSLDGVDVNDATSDIGFTALYCACGKGRILVVELLLAHDSIDVNKARADYGATPLYAACYNGRTEAVNALLACDAIDVNKARTHNGSTPLNTACRKGHTATVHALLTCDEIDVNKARTDSGSTPLWIACYYGHIEAVEALLACNTIDVNSARTDDGTTPLFTACSQGCTAVVKALLASGNVDVNTATTEGGYTPLYIACYHGHTGIVNELLACDAIDANKARADGGTTPLYAACRNGHTKAVNALLACDEIDVNKTRTIGGDTPLHVAAWKGYLLVVQQLVVCGANRHTRTLHNSTALQLAIKSAKHDVAAWLQATAGWSPLKVAAACRLHTIAAMQLRNGSIDPDDPTTTTPAEVLAIVAVAQVPVDALPWENALPVCNATIKLMEAAAAGWSRTAHWLHHRGVRQTVHTLLLVSERLHRASVANSNSDEAEGAAALSVG